MPTISASTTTMFGIRKTKMNWSPTNFHAAKNNKELQNPDNDPRGLLVPSAPTPALKLPTNDQTFTTMIHPKTDRRPSEHGLGIWSRNLHETHVRNNLIYWVNGNNERPTPYQRNFLNLVKEPMPPSGLTGSRKQPKKQCSRGLACSKRSFGTPKPERLLQRILHSPPTPRPHPRQLPRLTAPPPPSPTRWAAAGLALKWASTPPRTLPRLQR